VLAVYLAALVAALGAFGVQLVFGHHDAGGGGDHDVSHGGDGHDHDASAWSLVASVRFWSFALLAFGLVGTLLTVFGFAGPLVTGLLAAFSGAGAGVFAVTIIRRLTYKPASSHATGRDVVGKLGRMVVPVDERGRGKVRVEIKGSFIDYVARSKESIPVEDAVVIEEFDGDEAVVSRAPKELKE
jgi:membrane protein implicated in regulation of membrane protease activity